MLKVLDLFSGIGGFSLGLERTGGFETVAFCEIDPFCRKVLSKHWPGVPIYEDVRTINDDTAGIVFDVLTGGYPCQPFSQAGKRKGAEDDRHLWPAMFEVIKRHRPAWIVGENVAGHISMGLDEVLSDLESAGYAVRPIVIPACAVDAPHRRDRVWIIAHTDRGVNNSGAERARRKEGSDISGRCARSTLADTDSEQRRTDSRKPNPRTNGRNNIGRRCKTVANSERERQPRQGGAEQPGDSASNENREIHRAINDCGWCPEPSVGRVANGIPRRVDRLRALGNAVVPQIPEILGHAILEAEGLIKQQSATLP